MSILSWKNEYSVGVGAIDEEHKRLVALINKAYDSIVDGGDQDVMRALVKEMRAYASEHFATEERFMREYAYPDADAHRREHKEFMVRAVVNDTQLDFRGEVPDAVGVFGFLAAWLNDHILQTDMKLGEFLQEKNAG